MERFGVELDSLSAPPGYSSSTSQSHEHDYSAPPKPIARPREVQLRPEWWLQPRQDVPDFLKQTSAKRMRSGAHATTTLAGVWVPNSNNTRHLASLGAASTSKSTSIARNLTDIDVKRPVPKNGRSFRIIIFGVLPGLTIVLVIMIIVFSAIVIPRKVTSDLHRRWINANENNTPRVEFTGAPWATHPAVIAGSITGFFAVCGLTGCAAYTIRRRRDRQYEVRNADKWTTQLSIHDRFPTVLSGLKKATKLARWIKPRPANAQLKWASEWVHNDRDDVIVKKVRKEDFCLQQLSRMGVPASLAAGHEASASAPDLIERIVSHSGTNNPPLRDLTVTHNEITERKSASVPHISVTELQEARGCRSNPISRSNSPAGARGLDTVPETEESSQSPTLDL